MGLDSFWVRGEEPCYLDFEPELCLIGGIFSGAGSGSLRGKSYSDFIENISGISLYQELMPNSEVKQIAEALEAGDMQSMIELLQEDWGGHDEDYGQHISDLIRMFRAYADAGACLAGWW